jgi:MATE family multidrug resistance protein
MINIKDINKLALPAILYNIIEPLIGLVDTAVLGRLDDDVSTLAQAGVGLAAGLISTLIWGLAQVRTAVSSIVSQNLETEKQKKIKSLIPQALLFTIFLGVVFGLLTSYFFQPLAETIFDVNKPGLLHMSNEYFQIRIIGLPLSLLIAGFFGIFRGHQNTMYAMYAGATGAIVNIILDLVLVNGFAGIPAYGIAGVAWASVISQLTMVAVCVYFMHFKTPFDFNLKRKINPHFTPMLKITGNMLLRTTALNMAFLVALRYAGGYGTQTLTAYSYGIQIWLFSSFFIDGYSSAGNAMAGKFIGDNNIPTLVKLSTTLLKINCRIAILLSLFYLATYYWMASLFTNDTEVIRIFNSFFWIIIIAQPINSIAFTFDGIYKGLGNAVLLRNTLFIGTFLLFFPALIFSDWLNFNVFSIWIAFVLWMTFRGLSLWHHFRQTYHTNQVINGQ